MKPITLKISRKQGDRTFGLGLDALQMLLKKQYVVTGHAVSGQPGDSCDFDFGDKATRKKIYEELVRFRGKPGSLSFDEKISQTFGKLFYSKVTNALNVSDALKSNCPVLISINSRESQLITNIPWEIADISPVLQNGISYDLPSNTIAVKPFGRVVNDFKSTTTINSREQLRVLCCISDPDPAYPLNGEAFAVQLKILLEKYKWLVDCRFVFGENHQSGQHTYCPLFGDLLAEINTFRPHLFVLASHGKTSADGPTVYFSGDKVNTFNWEKVSVIGQHLKNTKSCLSAILIACDLTYSDNSYSSSSGAMALLEKGIPSVVAMQTKILVEAGDEFLDSLLIHFTKGISNPPKHLIYSTAFGRQRIADKLGLPETRLDWSFPALFFTEDGYDSVAEMENLIDNYAAWLTNLKLYSFQVIDRYFTRKNIEDELMDNFRHSKGLKTVSGELGCGKSELIKKVCLDIYAEVKTFQQCRPIIYFDFEADEKETLDNAGRFFDLINAKIKSVTTFDDNSESDGALFRTIPSMKQGSAPDRHLLEWLDRKPRIFIFDNLTEKQLENIALYCEVMKHLKESLVVVCGQSGLDKKDIHVGNLEIAEVKGYLRHFSVTDHDDASIDFCTEKLVEFSSGNLLLMSNRDVEAIIADPDLIIINEQSISIEAKMNDMLKILSEENDMRDAYLRLASFPSGISKEMKTMIGIEDEVFEELVDNKLLVEFYCKSEGVKEPITIYKVPQYARLALKHYHSPLILDQMDVAFNEIADYFFLEGDTGVKERKALALTESQYKLDFLRDVIDLFSAQNDTWLGDFIMQMIDKKLYESGQLEMLCHLWQRVLDDLPQQHHKPISWLRLAKVSQLTGRLQLALSALQKVGELFVALSEKGKSENPIDRVDYFTQSATTLKEIGDRESEKIIAEYHNNACNLIQEILDKEGESPDIELQIKQGLVHYNRAIFRRWWQRDMSGAIEDISSTIGNTKSIYPWLYYLAISERADMLIDFEKNKVELYKIKSELLDVVVYYEKEQLTGELPLLYYRIAKLERRLCSPGNETEHINKAIDFYVLAKNAANKIQYPLLECIAEAHIISTKIYAKQNSIAISNVLTTDNNSLIDQINKAIENLKVFDGIWPRRVLRDLLIEQAVFSVYISLEKNKVEDYFKNTISFAMSDIFDLEISGTDRKKAAYILVSYYGFCKANGEHAKLDILNAEYKDIVAKWFDEAADQNTLERNLPKLKLLTLKPNSYG